MVVSSWLRLEAPNWGMGAPSCGRWEHPILVNGRDQLGHPVGADGGIQLGRTGAPIGIERVHQFVADGNTQLRPMGAPSWGRWGACDPRTFGPSTSICNLCVPCAFRQRRHEEPRPAGLVLEHLQQRMSRMDAESLQDKVHLLFHRIRRLLCAADNCALLKNTEVTRGNKKNAPAGPG